MNQASTYQHLDQLVQLTKQQPTPLENFLERLHSQLEVVRLFKNWPVSFLDYFKLVKSPTIIYKMRNGLRYKVRAGTTDRGVLNEIWIKRDYSPKGFEIAPDHVIVDIGGQLGSFAVMAARQASAGKVIVYEPTTANHSVLGENLALNRLTNVRLYQKAVAGTDGRARIHLSTSNTGGHSLSWGLADRPASEEVATLSLATVFKENNLAYVDLLKVDCEGAEYDIFRQCPDALFPRIRKIAMEYHEVSETENGAALKQLLEQKGFRVWINRSLLYAIHTTTGYPDSIGSTQESIRL